jgi:hypothetical protein
MEKLKKVSQSCGRVNESRKRYLFFSGISPIAEGRTDNRNSRRRFHGVLWTVGSCGSARKPQCRFGKSLKLRRTNPSIGITRSIGSTRVSVHWEFVR